MTAFKIVCVYVFPDRLTCFADIGILSKVCLFVFETAKPSLNHDVISPAAFAVHTLMDMVLVMDVDGTLTDGKIYMGEWRIF